METKDIWTSAAMAAWDAYSEASGGKTYDGKPLPTWQELGEDKQAAWRTAAKAAIAYSVNTPSVNWPMAILTQAENG